jgi:hypothetical protein
MKNPLRHFIPGVLLITTALLAGCVSTQERFEKGIKLENSGRYEQAADAYIRVLQKESHREEARQRLLDSGSRIVRAALDQANALEDVGRYEEAVAALARLDNLRDRTASVGVSLPVPGDYEEYRESLATGAVSDLIARAQQAERSGDYASALRLYDRVQQRYEIPETQRRDVESARVRVLVQWADADLVHGRFRAAHAHAGQILQIVGPDAPEGRDALAIQEDALREGTRYVAYLPVTATDAIAEEGPRGFTYEVSEVLQYEHWMQPPLFLAPVPPADLNRELRRFRYDRGPLSLSQATEVGRGVDADFVVLAELTRFEVAERPVREARRAVRTKGRAPVDTFYVELEYDLKHRAVLSYQILDPHTRSVLHQGTAEASASDRFERGVYRGDWQTLNLSRAAARLFDEEAHRRREQELQRELIDELTLDLAHHVQPALVDRIP